MAEMAPDLALNVCAMGISLHVWQRVFLHGLDFPLRLSCLGMTFNRTRMSLRLFGRLNAIIVFLGKIRLRPVFVTLLCSHIFLVLRDHGVNMYVVYI